MTAEKELSRLIARDFPGLDPSKFTITSSATSAYNCIAWAANDNTRWWWPVQGYWPGSPQVDSSIGTFVAGFSTLGYTTCADTRFEPGFQKIALYGDGHGQISHAARQLTDGNWTSKLGSSVDITHQLVGLEGKTYGQVVQILRKPAESLPATGNG